MARFGLSDYDAMAKGRKLWACRVKRSSAGRWLGAEVSPDEISKVVNRDIEQKKQVPQIGKDWKWFAVDPSAGEKKVHSTQMAKEGKIPNKALGGVSIRYYRLSDRRVITREFWHRADPGDEDRGNRMLRLIWSTHMGPDRLSQYEPLQSSIRYGVVGGTMLRGGFGPGKACCDTCQA